MPRAIGGEACALEYSDSGAPLPKDAASRMTRGSRRSWPAEDQSRPVGGPEQEDRVRIRADDVYL